MHCVLGRALPSSARPTFPKFLVALTASLALALMATATAFGGATQSVVYCGDPLDIPNCNSSGNYNWANQKAIIEERTLTDPGEYVWTGQFRYSYGFIPGNDPIGGAPNSGDPQIFANQYTDPAGELTAAPTGLAFDAASNTIFIASAADGKVMAFNRGSFAQYPVDYTRGFFVSANGARGIDFDSVSGQLVVAESDSWRLNRYDFTPGDRVSPAPDGGPVVTYASSFGSNEWSDEGTKPVDVVIDPANGHSFVAVNSQDQVYEYDENDENVQVISTGLVGPGGVTRALAIDAAARLLYILKSGTIEVVSISTGAVLGILDIGFEQTDSSSLQDLDLDPVSRTLYVVSSQIAAADDSEAPVAAYALDPPPTCNLQPVTMLPGASRAIIPNCIDVEGGVIEYSIAAQPSGGSATNTDDRSAIDYSAPAQPGTYTIPFRARSMNGRSAVVNQTVTIAAATTPANLTPVVRKTANLELASGIVQIKLPGTDVWIPLTQATLIPVGTVIDARKGKAHLTFANADGTLQDGIFWEGIFQVSQGSGDKPIVTLKLRDDLAGKANAAIASSIATAAGFQAYTARKKGKKKNGLWGDAKGKYKTSGKGGSATVRGTRWYVANYANGSLFKVARGSVTIDPIRGKNFVLKSGKQFFIFYKKNP